MSAAATLREARALVAQGWTQGTFARDDKGNPTKLADATCYCAMGAVYRASDLNAASSFVAFDLLEQAIRSDNIAVWNDRKRRTQKEVIAAFSRAIELAEKSA